MLQRGSPYVPRRREVTVGGPGMTPEGPLPIVEGILAATREPGSPSRCFPGHLLLIQPLECLSVQLWKEQGLEVRARWERKGVHHPHRI